jgi:hypothetical protein
VKYKTFEELKEELGDKFEEYMYKANIELLNKIDKVIKLIENNYYSKNTTDIDTIALTNNKMLQVRQILKDSDD